MNNKNKLEELKNLNRDLNQSPFRISTGLDVYQVKESYPDGIYNLPVYKVLDIRNGSKSVNDGRPYVWAQTDDLLWPIPVKADSNIIAIINNGEWRSDRLFKIEVKTWKDYPKHPINGTYSRTANFLW